MLYPFMTICSDETEITHSEVLPNGEVMVYIETPDEKDGFRSLKCFLPSYRLEEVKGYTEAEVEKYLDFIRRGTHLFFRYAKCGGFMNIEKLYSDKKNASSMKGDLMLYPFMTLNDDTEITHTEVLPNGEVMVNIETPDARDGFHSLECYLPSYRLENVIGYTDAEVEYYLDFIREGAHLFLRFAKIGGILNADAV